MPSISSLPGAMSFSGSRSETKGPRREMKKEFTLREASLRSSRGVDKLGKAKKMTVALKARVYSVESKTLRSARRRVNLSRAQAARVAALRQAALAQVSKADPVHQTHALRFNVAKASFDIKETR